MRVPMLALAGVAVPVALQVLAASEALRGRMVQMASVAQAAQAAMGVLGVTVPLLSIALLHLTRTRLAVPAAMAVLAVLVALVARAIMLAPLASMAYGNAAALALWEATWEELTRTPSRLTAEAPERSERERLLAAVARDGFIDDYAGVRISRSGRRFRIRQATVWNLLDERGERCGQAATFAAWELL
jgi:hypothetical protein